MRSGSDPNAIVDALERATDAFHEDGLGIPDYETGIETDDDWKTQLTKGCRLLAVVDTIRPQGFHTATIELCFAAIERSIEAYTLHVSDDALRDFHDHSYCYRRAIELGLFTDRTADEIADLYGENRTESYYGGRRPTAEQATAMADLAVELHEFVVDQIREAGVCTCD